MANRKIIILSKCLISALFVSFCIPADSLDIFMAAIKNRSNLDIHYFWMNSIIYGGIYGYYFIYKMAHDVNIACDGDGENTSGLVAFILLSMITCGIYAWYWYYKLGNRLANNAGRYGLVIQENGTTVLMWCIFGTLICGIGPFIAMHILIKNSNMICNAYNRAHGLM